MGTNECSQSASKSSWDSQDFGDVNMVLKMAHFTSPLGHNELTAIHHHHKFIYLYNKAYFGCFVKRLYKVKFIIVWFK